MFKYEELKCIIYFSENLNVITCSMLKVSSFKIQKKRVLQFEFVLKVFKNYLFFISKNYKIHNIKNLLLNDLNERS